MSKQKFELTSGKMLAGSILVSLLLIAVVVPLSLKSGASAGGTDEVESRIQPVAKLEVQAAAAAAGGAPMDGPTVYNTVCAACHASGAVGAPKTGDKGAWGARIAAGKPTLYNSALNGKNAMPARGGKATLSDAEVKAAVDYLIGQAK